MSAIVSLREFFNERLNTFAEDVFRVFEKAIVEYEEEISRQRTLLDIAWKPAVKLHRIELPPQHFCKEEEVFTDQQLCNPEGSPNPDQEDPEPPQNEARQEEVLTSQDREQLVLKQETDTFMLCLTFEEGDRSKDQTLHLNPDESQSAPQTESDHQLLPRNSYLAESQDDRGDKRGNSVSTGNVETPHDNIHSNSVLNSTMPNIPRATLKGKKSFKCDTCGKVFRDNYKLKRHFVVHTGLKLYACNICGKRFGYGSELKIHKRIHTGERPYCCNECGKRFIRSSALTAHLKTHIGAKTYSCKTCGKCLKSSTHFLAHMRTHTGEKPYVCKICEGRFSTSSLLKRHLRRHSGVRPHVCNTCGKGFYDAPGLKRHLRIHTRKK